MYSPLILFALLFSLPALAEGTGHVSLGGTDQFVGQPTPTVRADAQAEFEFEQNFELSSTTNFHFHPWGRASTAPGVWQNQQDFDPREIDFGWQISPEVLGRFGFFTLKWEGTDGLNPMDIATMKNFGDPLNSPTKASLGAQLSGTKGPIDWEVAWIPQQTSSAMPGGNSPWWPRKTSLPVKSSQEQLLLPDQVAYQFTSRQELNHALSNNIALRLQSHLESVDLAIASVEGAAQTPILQPVLDATLVGTPSADQIVLQLNSPVVIQSYDYRRRTTAASVGWTKGAWIFRAASRYDQSLGDSSLLPGWSQQTVLGFERSLQFGNKSVTAIVQGAWSRHPQDGSLISVQDLFDRALLLGLRMPIGDDLTITVSGFKSDHDGSSYEQIESSYRWSDHWGTTATVQALQGPAMSLLGILRDNSRAGLKTSYAF